ncbi:DUF402 domain-containing protein [Streptomyces mesophilus]|uniref:DUF402 domain-containing protein n=1 Tax=Streptomyces mesophilus TaxID=1775132 RepID=UPI0033344D2C
MTDVTVEFRKYDGRLSARWTAKRLGADAHGTWLATAQGIRVESADGGWSTRFPYVLCVPQHAWWTATFCRPPGPEVYCDVSTPAQWARDGAEVRIVDLDLDVVRLPGAEPHIEDEDEFAVHRERLGYPEHVVAEALSSCSWLYEAVRRQSPAELFSSAYLPWLGRV